MNGTKRMIKKKKKLRILHGINGKDWGGK